MHDEKIAICPQHFTFGWISKDPDAVRGVTAAGAENVLLRAGLCRPVPPQHEPNEHDFVSAVSPVWEVASCGHALDVDARREERWDGRKVYAS